MFHAPSWSITRKIGSFSISYEVDLSYGSTQISHVSNFLLKHRHFALLHTHGIFVWGAEKKQSNSVGMKGELSHSVTTHWSLIPRGGQGVVCLLYLDGQLAAIY